MAGRTLNKVQIIGRLGKDPELRYTTGGKAVANLSVATGGESWTSQDGKEHTTPTEWHRIVAWEPLAKVCADYLHTGSQVYVEGKLQTDKYDDKNGVTRYTTSIVLKSLIMLGSKGESESKGHDEPPTGDHWESEGPPSSDNENIPF